MGVEQAWQTMLCMVLIWIILFLLDCGMRSFACLVLCFLGVSAWFQPPVRSTWQWQLEGVIENRFNVCV